MRLPFRDLGAQAQRVHAHDGGDRGPGPQILADAGPLFLDGAIEWCMDRRVGQLLACQRQLRATLRHQGLPIAHFFDGILIATEGDLIGRLRTIQLGMRHDPLIEQRHLAVAIGLGFLEESPGLTDRTRLFRLDAVGVPPWG